jgi:hypothetical protein
MPPDDGVVQVPIPGLPEGESDMPLADNLHEQNMATLGQTGVVAQNNFVTVQKVIDYDHIEQKRIVSLDEAVGVREVQSEYNPGGPKRSGV